MERAVQFPVSWIKPEEIETVWLGDRAHHYRDLPPEAIVKMHWQRSGYAVTYADGSRWCNIKDLDLYYQEEDNE